MYGMELLNSSQAIDLRKKMKGETEFGKGTSKLYKAYRKVVPYIEADRILTTDIEKSKNFVLNYEVK